MSVELFNTATEEETVELGRTLARRLSRGALVLLIGNLGAGKTTLAKGIIEGLGAAPVDDVSSPTFTLIHEYGSVYHIDLYRLDTADQVRGLGIDELLDREAVMLVEWGERFPDLWPDDRVEIRIDTSGSGGRSISYTAAPSGSANKV